MRVRRAEEGYCEDVYESCPDCYMVQVRFPRFAPMGRPGRWVTPAISAELETARGYADTVYARVVAPTGELPEAVRVVSERELGEEQGELAIVQAYRDLRWFAEQDAAFGGPLAGTA